MEETRTRSLMFAKAQLQSSLVNSSHSFLRCCWGSGKGEEGCSEILKTVNEDVLLL